MKKSLFLILMLFTIGVCLVACKTGTGPVDTTDTQDTTASPEDTTSTTPTETTTATETTTEPVTEPPVTEPIVVTYEDIPEFDSETRKVKYDCGDGVFMKLAINIVSSDYYRYIEKLSSLGYELIDQRENGTMEFAHFRKDGVGIATSYFPAEHEARVFIMPYDPYTAYDIYADSSKVGTVEPLITMVGLNYDAGSSGTCYIIRTTTGSFIIIDGGVYSRGDTDNILSILNEQNVNGGTPEIAAWILTHPHSDHIGTICEFALGRKSSSINVKRVIFNFTNDQYLQKSDIGGSSTYAMYKNFLAAMDEGGVWQDTQIIKPHSGDLLYIDGITVDIYRTHEETYPDESSLLYQNANSMSMMISYGENKMLILGDTSGGYMKKLATWYRDDLKCNVLQPTHHGRTHGWIPTYELCAPDICMWPTYLASIEQYGSQDYNVWLDNNVATHYYSYLGNTTISFVTLELK